MFFTYSISTLYKYSYFLLRFWINPKNYLPPIILLPSATYTENKTQGFLEPKQKGNHMQYTHQFIFKKKK